MKVKDIMETFKQMFRVHRKDMIVYEAIALGGGIVGIVIALIILAVDGTGEDYGTLGAFFAQIFGVIGLFFGGIFALQQEFNLAISMGKTRKSFVPARYLFMVLEVLLLEGIVICFNRFEEMLYTKLYPNAISELDLGGLTGNPGLFVGIVLGVPVILMLFGALMMKFSAKFFWVLWAIWMFGCMGLPRIIHAMEETPESGIGRLGLAVISFLEEASAAGLVTATAVLLVACMAVTYGLFKRQRVTG